MRRNIIVTLSTLALSACRKYIGRRLDGVRGTSVPLSPLFLALVLAGCGGGGGTTSSSSSATSSTPTPPNVTVGGDPVVVPVDPTPTPTPTPTNLVGPVDTSVPYVLPPYTAPAMPVTPVVAAPPAVLPSDYARLVSDVAPSCTNCGAENNKLYNGNGPGIWHKKNIGTVPQDVSVAIAGLVGKDVTYILTNETNADVALPPLAMSSFLQAPAPLLSMSAAPATPPGSRTAVEAFNHSGWKTRLAHSGIRPTFSQYGSSTPVPQLAVAEPRHYVTGDTRVFKHHDGSDRLTTLKQQVAMTDGVVINFWLENREDTATALIPGALSGIVGSFTHTGGVYSLLLDIGGPLWGPHNNPEMISGNGQPIDIVLINFNNDGQPFGEAGYFYAQNNFKRSVMPDSNESISLYLDTETIYLGAETGYDTALTTLAHETLHMSNFYRRGVLMGPASTYDTWLEEMTAMMLEDAIGNRLAPGFNVISRSRFPAYLTTPSYNCSLLEFTPFTQTCESNSVSGSFGGFLLRQMGLPLLKDLLTRATSDSELALQQAIKTFRPSSSIGEEMRKFAVAAIPLMSASTAPAGFNFPRRIDGIYSMPFINPQDYVDWRQLPQHAPTVLKAYASFPVEQKSVTGTFLKTVRVPAGVTLSVVVH